MLISEELSEMLEVINKNKNALQDEIDTTVLGGGSSQFVIPKRSTFVRAV